MKHRGTARQGGRGSAMWLIIFPLLIILGGIEALVLSVPRLQDAAQLAAAPVCPPGQQQQTGCRLDQRVTVVDRYTESFGRGGSAHVVKVQAPDGRTQIVYVTDHDAGLWARLQVGEQLNAELWNGSVVRLDDGAGHYVIADDSPEVTSMIFPIIGIAGTAGGGILLALFVRARRQSRKIY